MEKCSPWHKLSYFWQEYFLFLAIDVFVYNEQTILN